MLKYKIPQIVTLTRDTFSLSVLAEMIQAGLHKFFLLPLPGKVGNVLPAIRLLCRIRMFLCPVLM